ncbi:MAG TPA: hypothetical protein VFG33_00280 [Kribbella sp.]|uniref:hypothetical protein n=1 Tax=Kribbella sp. TaxID=1871183 RepID=UPI002D7903A4|nr:hypothetical protein [Kribbella sp.]HET6291766.1 hypothetical protein [Kribbella sp.]
MTHTELKQRLSMSVDDIDAPSDLAQRARQAGSRRLRRRRLTSLTAAALVVIAVGGGAVARDSLLDRIRPDDVGMSAAGDPYGFLMKGSTRGDLADDKAYLNQVVQAWQRSHATSQNQDRGIFDNLRGEPKVAWAGTTPAGRAAVVVQQSYLRHHDNIQLDHEGIYTLAGFVGEGADGTATLVADSYPAPGVGMATGFVTGASGRKALVVLDTGQEVGWSHQRIYADDGSSRHDYTPLKFEDGVSVVELPAGVDLDALRLSPLPAENRGWLHILGVPFQQGSQSGGDKRLWPESGWLLWAMTSGAEDLRKSALDSLDNVLEEARDPAAYLIGSSMWAGYGRTPDGSRLLLGEHILDSDPTRVYAVLTSKAGSTTIIPGGVPDKNAALPVSIKLPDGQGWAVAQKDAQLSYRFEGGAWTSPRANASLVPAGQDVEVKVVLRGVEKIVQLR